MTTKLTEDEARELLEMLKHCIQQEVSFPDKGTKSEFEVYGKSKKDLFTICIFRGKINAKKYNLSARIKVNSIVLLELHINPSNVHPNPDGTKITGSHWHIYTEEYGLSVAIPADDIDSNEFVDNTITFLKKFNVITLPSINAQIEF